MTNQTVEELQYEKTGLLADLDRDQVARDMDSESRKSARERVRQINARLDMLKGKP